MEKNILKKISALFLGLALVMGAGVVGTAKGEVKEASAATTATYKHVFNAKPSTGTNVTLSGIKWSITATKLGNYNSSNYAGVQIGTSNAAGSIKLTSSDSFVYQTLTKVKEIRLWLNGSGTTVNYSASIGGTSATSDNVNVVKNSSAVSDWTKATKITFKPAASPQTGVVEINASCNKAMYICAMEIDVTQSVNYTVSKVTINNEETFSETISDARIGDTKQLTASVTYDGDAGDGSVTWASSDATIASVNSSGLVTYLKNGTTIISATSNDDDTKVATYTLTLSNLAAKHGTIVTDPLTVTEAYALLDAGTQTDIFYVEGLIKVIDYFNNNNKYYTLTIVDDLDDTNVFKFLKLKNTANPFDGKEGFEVGGKIMAHGKLVIYNSYYEFDSSCEFDSYTAPVVIEATNMSFTPSTIEVNNGETGSFTPTLSGGSNNFEKTITWTSSHPSIIAAPEDSEDGVEVTVAPENVIEDTEVTLTGTVVSPGSATASIIITVKYIADSVTANAANYDVMAGTTLDLTTCVTAAGGGELSFTTESEACSIEGTTLTAGDNAAEAFVVTAHKGDESCTFTVTITENNGWTKVTSTNDLVVGAKYTITSTDGTLAIGTQNTNNILSTATSLIGGKLAITDEVMSFRLLKASDGKYAFYNEDTKGLLSAVSGQNYLKSNGDLSTTTDSTHATITISSTHVATIQFKTNNRYIKLNSTGNLFSCYTVGQKDICLYKSNDPAISYGETWAQAFLDLCEIACDVTGNTPLAEDDWTDIKDDFAGDSYSIPEKMAALYGTAGTDSKLEKAFALYDYIVGKYGYNNFLNRLITAKSPNYVMNLFGYISNSTNSSSKLAIISSLVLLPGICGLLIIRKRKNEESR